MSRIGNSAETGNRLLVIGALGVGGGLTIHAYGISFGDDKKFLKLIVVMIA